ncbi:MAG: transposase [Lachnospiraceae bacterium]|nr:transposase [Lachnospiraceae bacterium]
MARKLTGKVTKNRAQVLQKNGDIYIYEREYKYNPETRKTERILNKLVAKIPKGTDKEVPTRPKRKTNGAVGNDSGLPSQLLASRQHTGLTDILDHVGKVSGIDHALFSSTDYGTALKIISIARFLAASSGDSLPHIQTWQLTHPIPYEEGITEDIYYTLCRDVGKDETLRQSFFQERCRQLGSHPLTAFDSTTQSTYSGNQIDARYGFNKDKDGLKTIKYLTLYSVDDRQPVAFTKQPGNLPDVTSLSNALKQLDVLGQCRPEIVTDNGYYSEENLAGMCLGGFRFITLAKTSTAWVRKELDRHKDDIITIKNRRTELSGIYCYTEMLTHTFEKTRKYASRKKGLEKGSVETFDKRIYLHLYFNPIKKENDDNAFYAQMEELKNVIEKGSPIDELSAAVQKKAGKYLNIKRDKEGTVYSVTYKEEECNGACRYHGYFALVSNHEKDCFEALKKYRKREKVEEYFQMAKEDADASKTRVWYADHLMGRMMVQFIALAYEDYLRYRIGKMKAELGKENGDPLHDTKENLAAEQNLKKWLAGISFSNILRWFDAYETTKVSTKISQYRWGTETTNRDRLFLKKLGM